jgi:hypothetical protein
MALSLRVAGDWFCSSALLLCAVGCVEKSTLVAVDLSREVGPQPNVVWVVTESYDAGIEELLKSGLGTAETATLSLPTRDRGLLQSFLLTGADTDTLGLDYVTGTYTQSPAPGVAVIAEALRRGGYYASRSGPVLHALSGVPARSIESELGGDVWPAQPGVLGAWDASGIDADWRDRFKDWDYPCTVAFGCGGPANSSGYPFFSLFTVGTSGSPTALATVSRVLDQLNVDGLTEETAVFVVSIDTKSPRVTVRWPVGHKPTGGLPETVGLLDLAPTTLALVGLRVPSYMNGQSLVEPVSRRPPLVLSEADMKHPTRSGQAQVAATPSGYPTGGLFHAAPTVELRCDTLGATIVYTTEREEPFYWRLYQGPFRMRFWELRAQCGRLGYRDSEIVAYEFDIE